MNTITQIPADAQIVTAPFSVDTSKGSVDGSVSRQWMSRPADEKFNTLTELRDTKKRIWDASWEAIEASEKAELFGVERADGSYDLEGMKVGMSNVRVAGADVTRTLEVAPTHFAFGQLCGLANAPTPYLRTLPSPLAADNINYGLRYNRKSPEMKFFGDDAMLKAATGTGYGRIPDWQIVEALIEIAGDGLGNSGHHWKAPGRLNWSNGTYNPEDLGPVSDRTFYGSDRDLFVFLVDDRRPICVGKTRDGQDDNLFRGFYAQNSEVGNRSLKLVQFYLRGVCMNRNLWGVEQMQELVIRHSSLAPKRWLSECLPILESFASGSDKKVIEGVAAAKAKKLVDDKDSAQAFLAKRKFTMAQITRALENHERDEGHPVKSAWDMAQAITAEARSIPYTNERIAMEREAKHILDAVI